MRLSDPQKEKPQRLRRQGFGNVKTFEGINVMNNSITAIAADQRPSYRRGQYIEIDAFKNGKKVGQILSSVLAKDVDLRPEARRGLNPEDRLYRVKCEGAILDDFIHEDAVVGLAPLAAVVPLPGSAPAKVKQRPGRRPKGQLDLCSARAGRQLAKQLAEEALKPVRDLEKRKALTERTVVKLLNQLDNIDLLIGQYMASQPLPI